ncbi:DUF3072 domain-containing protein [Oceaniglobus indicus]|uniref:DUF3072 domain-containing protein n=1 Tax=Oceaniglobus indicus TaxID=2047749 RepID=UPI000C19C7E9|nr:DUF3072 domain-containing protein [Oceaniglobus indicus]
MATGANPDIIAATTIGATSSPDTTGDDPMTEKQAAELRALCEETGEPFDGNLTSAQAQDRIDYLKSRTDD